MIAVPFRPVLAALSLLLAVPAAALTIDNFEEGDFTVIDTSADLIEAKPSSPGCPTET